MPPLSTVVLMTAPFETSTNAPLLMRKPETVLPLTISVPPAPRCVLLAIPPLARLSVPPLKTVTLLARPPLNTSSVPPFEIAVPMAVPPDSIVCEPPVRTVAPLA